MAAHKKRQKKATQMCLWAAKVLEIVPKPPIIITITRVGPRRLDDDNLASACKYVRDAIAADVGVDDGSPLYTWQYRQHIGKYGVDVEIKSR